MIAGSCKTDIPSKHCGIIITFEKTEVSNYVNMVKKVLVNNQHTLTEQASSILITLPSKIEARHVASILKERKEVIQAQIIDNEEPSAYEISVIKGKVQQLVDQRDECLMKHNEKIHGAEKRVNNATSIFKSRRRGINELPLVQAEKSVLKELIDQKNEFEVYCQKVLSYLDKSEICREHFRNFQKIDFNFQLECKRFTSALPIYARKSDIIKKIEENCVTILTAETGSGKSTQLVQYLYDEGFGNGGLIACTQPRKVAAISVAKRVSTEMNSVVGQRVGYRVGMDNKVNKETSIVFMTDQLLLNECLKDSSFSKYNCIVVDEAHERSIGTDLLLAMIKKAFDSRPDLRLIISSATIDPHVFLKYFQQRAKSLHVKGRTFPVDIIWAEESLRSKYFEAAVEKVKVVHRTAEPGDILVFLTTPLETEKAQEMINKDRTMANRVTCLILHGRLSSEEQQRIFEPADMGKRKIVFATNSAETSITIPKIKFVIDSGMVKEKHFDRDKDASILRVGPINRSSAEQRMGRAGRMEEGKCYRLFTNEEYNEMDDGMLPEILRENLGLALLKLFQLGINDPLNYDFVESPPRPALVKALKDLKELGALQENDGTEARNSMLTHHGQLMACVEIQPRLGKFIALGIESHIAMDAIAIASICSVGGNVFFRAGSETEKEQADRLKTTFCDYLGDMITLLTVFKEWYLEDDRKKNIWCKKNSINAKTLRLTKDKLNEIKRNVETLRHAKLGNDFSDSEIVNEVVPNLLVRCYTNHLAYYSGHERGGYNRLSYGYEHLSLHPSSALSMLSIFPVWVVYESILTTSRPFLLNATVVPNEVCERLNRQIKGNVVSIVYKTNVGEKAAQRLGLGRWNGSLEESMKQNINEEIYIDRDKNTGEVSLFTNDKSSRRSIEYLKSHVKNEQLKLINFGLELPMSEGNPVSIIVGQGGVLKDILYPDEYISVVVLNPQKKLLDVKDIEKRLKTFGEISEIVPFKPESYCWGKVVFTEKKAARKALEAYEGNGDEDEIKIKPDTKSKSEFNQVGQDYVMKASWIRRKGKGFGFLTFHDPNGADVLISHNTVTIGTERYTFTRSRKDNKAVMVRGINPYFSNDQVRNTIENQFPDVKVNDCSIPRLSQAKESSGYIAEVKKQLRVDISQYLVQIGSKDKSLQLDVQIPSNESFHELRGTIKFKTARVAQALLNANLTVGDALVTLTPDLRFFFTLDEKLHHVYADDIRLKITRIRGITLSVKPKNFGKKNAFETLIEAETINMLTIAQEAIRKIIRGFNRNCNEREFRFFKTPAGRKFINELIWKPNKCDIQLDYRNEALLIHASKTSIKNVLDKIEQKAGTLNKDEDRLTYNLSKGDFPNGFVKHLLVQYGVQLDDLYHETGVNYIRLNFLQHTIDVSGDKESLDIFKEAIDKVKAEVKDIEPDEDSVDCPVCLSPIGATSHQLELCGHSYCKECIQGMCEHDVNEKELPVSCVFDGCDSIFCLNDLISFVSDRRKLANASLEHFVGTSREYRYCVTPNCVMAYKISKKKDPEPFQCFVCQVLICTYCKEEHHTNISCSVNAGHEDESIKVWLSEPGTDRGICPSCSVPIERTDGCMHITCSKCHKHVCWRCKTAVFKTPAECYMHMGGCQGRR